jgi:thiopurine S-methyltransferase
MNRFLDSADDDELVAAAAKAEEADDIATLILILEHTCSAGVDPADFENATEAACDGLLRLTKGRPARLASNGDAVCAAVCHALSTFGSEPGIVEVILGCVNNFAADAACREKLGECSIAELLVAAMGEHTSGEATLQEQGCLAIAALADGSNANVARLLAAGAAKSLEAAIGLIGERATVKGYVTLAQAALATPPERGAAPGRRMVGDDRLARWEAGWASGRYSVPGQGFHQANVHPWLSLAAFLPRLELTPRREEAERDVVLIPLCGKTVDLLYIAELQIGALGLEAVPRAIAEFAELAGAPTPGPSPLHARAAHHWRTASGGLVAIVEGDALNFTVGERGAVDAVWDRGALVALRPEDRAAYVAMCAAALKPGKRILLAVVEHDLVASPEGGAAGEEDAAAVPAPYGPPFSFARSDVQALYEGRDDSGAFTLVEELARCDKLAEEPRWAEKGATLFREVCYLLERKVS